jgi:hypothetical protein
MDPCTHVAGVPALLCEPAFPGPPERAVRPSRVRSAAAHGLRSAGTIRVTGGFPADRGRRQAVAGAAPVTGPSRAGDVAG